MKRFQLEAINRTVGVRSLIAGQRVDNLNLTPTIGRYASRERNHTPDLLPTISPVGTRVIIVHVAYEWTARSAKQLIDYLRVSMHHQRSDSQAARKRNTIDEFPTTFQILTVFSNGHPGDDTSAGPLFGSRCCGFNANVISCS